VPYFIFHRPFSREWFQQSAEHGYPDAQNNIGSLYFNGHSMGQDYIAALNWYLLAVDQVLAAA